MRIHEAVANGQGNIAITASALGIGHNIDDAIAVASLEADASVGGILFQNNIDVHGKAIDPGTGRMTALGFAAIDANSGITVGGDISLTGDLTGNGLVAGSLHLDHVVELFQRFGSASLHVDAEHGDVSLGGVSVLANTVDGDQRQARRCSSNFVPTGSAGGRHQHQRPERRRSDPGRPTCMWAQI